MRQTLLLLLSLLLFTGCGSKANKPEASSEESIAPVSDVTTEVIETEQNPDEVICNAIADFLKGNKESVHFTEAAKEDLYESSWPKVQCSVEGLLDSPASFKDLEVKKVGAGKYKYECVCPDHGDRYTDCCTISASIGQEGVVMIEHVIWDDRIE